MKITVIGTGHVGLVVGGCLAEIGNDVLCLDSDASKIEALRAGRSPFYEPDLEAMVQRNQKAGRLAFTLEIEKAVAHSQVIFLCLGTPPLPSGEADLSVVERVTRQIATLSDGYKLVIGKSTVPVLTGQRIQKTMQLYSRGGANGDQFDVASNPEFLAEGTAVYDFLYPDRIVVGVESERAAKMLREIYGPVVRQDFPWNLERPSARDGREIPLLVTNRNSAELIKHASNSFLAMKISYINAVANLCDKVGADVEQVAHGMGFDHRIGPQFLKSGIGFGGFCFPKDLQAFVWIANQNGYDFQLLREVEKINMAQIETFLQKLRNEVWVLGGKTIAAWGLAFKPNTDDLRFSPALAVIEKLVEQGAKIRAYDPKGMEEARKEMPALTYCSSALEAAEGADALLVLTEWPEFKAVDLAALRSKMTRPLIIDGRNLFDAQTVRAAGFEYASMGRP